MTALAQDRQTLSRDGRDFSRPVAAATIIYAGSMVAIDTDGNLVPASADATLKVCGVADEYVDNSAGAAGDKSCRVVRGKLYRFGNSAVADEIALDDYGDTCYAVDDQTVALTSDTNTRPAAGIIRDVDANGVWVEIN